MKDGMVRHYPQEKCDCTDQEHCAFADRVLSPEQLPHCGMTTAHVTHTRCYNNGVAYVCPGTPWDAESENDLQLSDVYAAIRVMSDTMEKIRDDVAAVYDIVERFNELSKRIPAKLPPMPFLPPPPFPTK